MTLSITARVLLGIGATALLAASAPARAGDVMNGRKVALAKCQVCHGADGHARIPEAANLSGQQEQYIVQQLEAFRSGERKNEMMSIVAPTLSDNDVADVAAYYAGIEVKIEKVPGQ